MQYIYGQDRIKQRFKETGVAGVFECFCKDVKGTILSDEEADILKKCKKFGVHPILPALLQLEEPFPMFTAYTYAPADLLHTFLSGMMRDWIVTTEVFGKSYIYIFYT